MEKNGGSETPVESAVFTTLMCNITQPHAVITTDPAEGGSILVALKK